MTQPHFKLKHEVNHVIVEALQKAFPDAMIINSGGQIIIGKIAEGIGVDIRLKATMRKLED